MRTYWECPVCHLKHCTENGEGADIMTVVHTIDGDHRRLSPTCENPVGHLQVIQVVSAENYEAVS